MLISADLDALASAQEYVRLQAEAAGFSPPEVRKLELVTEEIVVNIIEHAYDGSPGQIGFECEASRGQLTLKVIDQGAPFNPLDHSEVDTSSSLSHREPGGLGLHFVRQLVDQVSYVREGDSNILTLFKRSSHA